MFATALGGNVASGSFENLQQGLLDAFARNVARNGNVFRFAGDFVDLVDIDDAALGALDVVIGILEEAQDDVFHVFTNIAGFGQGRGVGDGERDIEYLSECAGEQ